MKSRGRCGTFGPLCAGVFLILRATAPSGSSPLVGDFSVFFFGEESGGSEGKWLLRGDPSVPHEDQPRCPSVTQF